ncbi:Vomeronasal type-2 receptor 26 [Tupaia chinensis]|uniref:Vomeronasal type-2 receptor 26 n=1 Tax=Tupaia chinensis TaxID=246437 RepID=L9KMV6_TUPCH|nr:Vomeronasal type-2 receptor 26 [Tupaia chinensis]
MEMEMGSSEELGVVLWGKEKWYQWKNYRYILAFYFAIGQINKSLHLFPNHSLGYAFHNAFPSDKRTLESALFLLTGGYQSLPNYNCQIQKQPVAIIAGNMPTFSAQVGTLLELYKSPQVTYGPFDPILNNKDQFLSVYQMATKDSSLAHGIICLLLHFGRTWVALYVSDDMQGEQFLQDVKAKMTEKDICVAFTEKLPATKGVLLYRDFFVKRIRMSSANVYIIHGDEWSILSLGLKQNFYLILGKLHPFLRKSQLINSIVYNKPLDEKRKAVQYDIHNLVRFSNRILLLIKVGDFVYSSTHDQGLVINEDMIKWPVSFKETPESVHSHSCVPGLQKLPQEGRPICCFTCALCPESGISSQTNAKQCIQCPAQEYPNSERTHCLSTPVTFLVFEDALGTAMACMALCSFVLTATVLGVFVKHRDPPIVKANNQTLSFILLISLLLCFLCSSLFIGHPNTITCVLQQVAFGLVLTVAVSTVLAKTITVILAFKAMKPGRTMRCLFLSGASYSVIPICSLIQMIICGIWLGTSPPFIDIDSHSEPRTLNIMCNMGSVTAFYCVLGYLCFLALGIFTVAFLARNLPDTFNEAKLLTFSMLVFCSVRVIFVPIYHSTKGKFIVAVEVFSILASSAGILGCIFVPKCYIILISPDKNSWKALKNRRVYK